MRKEKEVKGDEGDDVDKGDISLVDVEDRGEGDEVVD